MSLGVVSTRVRRRAEAIIGKPAPRDLHDVLPSPTGISPDRAVLIARARARDDDGV